MIDGHPRDNTEHSFASCMSYAQASRESGAHFLMSIATERDSPMPKTIRAYDSSAICLRIPLKYGAIPGRFVYCASGASGDHGISSGPGAAHHPNATKSSTIIAMRGTSRITALDFARSLSASLT